MIDGPSVTAEAATDAPAPKSVSEKAADFENFLFEGEDPEEEDETQPEGQDGAEEGEDLELEDEEASDTEDEPATAIEPPASLNAEEKAAFAQLPTEAQELIRNVETRRNAQVQEATTRAAERERAAQTAAERAEVAADQRRAAQLWTFMEQFAPQMPSPQLAQTDPASYIAAKAQYDYQAAQFAELAQQVEAIDTQASARAAEIDQQQRVQDLMSVGKLADPATRDEYIQTSLGLVAELGLDPKSFEEVAGSEDFKALEKIADWKAKADKYEKAISRQMQKVRAGKGKNLRPNASPQDNRAARGGQDWQRVKTARSREAQNEAFADYLGL